jgi:hypothetical protein
VRNANFCALRTPSPRTNGKRSQQKGGGLLANWSVT